jgi:small-conductance mechanosensitive channel
MHIVAIAWLYVTLMMAITEKTITAGVMTFVFYGLLPCAVLLWLGGSARRRRAISQRADAARSIADEQVNHPDRADTRADQ